jgi:hypothetical protein
MGYLIVAVMAVVLLGFLLAAFSGKDRNKSGGGTLPSDHPVARSRPSADAPTPGASTVAGPAQQEQASRKTPPA